MLTHGTEGQVVVNVADFGGRQPPLSAPRGAFWLLLAFLAPVVAGLSTLGLWPLWQQDPVLAGAYTLLATALVLIGFVLVAEPGQVPAGTAMIASGAVLILSWANEWRVGPLPLLADACGNLWVFGCGWALYRYPDTSMSRGDRRIFIGLLAWLAVAPWLTVILSRPQWHGFARQAWWPALYPDRMLFHAAEQVIWIGNILLLGLYVGLWVRKIVTARPAVRRLKLPTAVAAIVAALAGALVPLGWALNATDATMGVVYTLSAVGVLAVPAAFLMSVVRRLVERQGVADMLLSLRGRPTPDLVLTSLRKALHDPTLEIAFWSEEHQQYQVNGERVTPAWAQGDVTIADVYGSTGEPLARIRVDQASAWDAALVDATIAASSLTLENAVLLTRVEQQLAQLRAASARIVRAGDAERSRIEQNLHDGAQQRFLTLNLLIGTLEAKTCDVTALEGLAEIREQLQLALRDLRDLTHGLHPSRLRLGLRQALKEIIVGYSFPVVLDLPDHDLPESVTLTAYYAIGEALANVSKHARASQGRVWARVSDNILQIQVQDDGRGGATPGSGRGLSGILDRVTAVGGRMDIDSPVGAGTRVKVWLPCE